MSILYTSIVYKNDKILCCYTDYYGNIQQTTNIFLKTIKKNNYKGTICFNNKYSFHYLDENNLTYICLTDKNYYVEVAHYYLTQIKELLFNNFNINQINLCDDFSMDQLLKSKIRQKVHYYNQSKTEVNNINNKDLLLYSKNNYFTQNFEIGKSIINIYIYK